MSRLLVLLAVLFAACLLGSAPARAEAAPAEAPERKTTHAQSFISLEPIYSSVMEGGRPRGLLMVEFGLDVPDAAMRAQIVHSLPLLRDAYVRGLLVYAATAVRLWRQPSVDDISTRMQAITDQLVGRKGAKVLMAQTAIRITQ
jgi:flagellar basal body-associated protein FliL